MTKLVRLGVPDLKEGELRGYEPEGEGGRLVCDLETGKNLVAPAICGDQQPFRVVEKDGELFAEID